MYNNEESVRKNKKGDYLDYLDKTRRNNGKTRLEVHEALMSKLTAQMYGLTDKEIQELEAELKQDTSRYPTPAEIENGAEDIYTKEKFKYATKKEVIQVVDENTCGSIECEV